MPYKELELPEIGRVRLYKHRYSRSLKIVITHQDFVRVTMPPWMPYRMGLEYAKSKTAWVQKHRVPTLALEDGQQIGIAHHLQLIPDARASSVRARTKTSELVVTYPSSMSSSDVAVQTAARRLATKALRAQAESLLPKRLATIAQNNGFSYNNVSIRILKSRWGSCNHLKQITLNIYLMLLPWELIDYVLVHELTHTRVLHHGPKFWAAMDEVLPDSRDYRARLKKFQPTI